MWFIHFTENKQAQKGEIHDKSKETNTKESTWHEAEVPVTNQELEGMEEEVEQHEDQIGNIWKHLK